jgi:serine/threonine protein kinase
MALTPGNKLGPYEIVSPLGAGGMGEVYRARDTRLDRTVAIKVLPQELSHDLAKPPRHTSTLQVNRIAPDFRVACES